jgi:hypothetical protein
MPWRGPREPGEYPTLGYLVGEWIESYCVVPDGELQGRPYLLTDEMWVFLLRFYRLHPDAVDSPHRPSAPFALRGAQLMRPQKWGKSPFAAAICIAEAFGPVRFAGWDRHGEPVGRSQPTPLIQIVATSEEQADNAWSALREMARRGRVADIPGIDIGVEDINLADGGKIQPRTSSGRARQGARLTFGLFEESHLMTTSNGGVKLATTMKRNLAGMSGRWLETTNAFDPSERSVAQLTQESAAEDVLIDYRPPTRIPDLGADDAELLSSLHEVYGDSYWVDLERVLADARDPAVCPTTADALRYFWNAITVGVADVVDPTVWDALARENDLQPAQMIALGFDGSVSQDCTSLVASRISDGRWFHLKTWNPSDYAEHKVPRAEVDAVITAAFEAYDVKYLYLDPPYWELEGETWVGRWPERVVQLPTASDKRMDDMISRFLAAVASGLTHSGDWTLTEHLRAAALAKGQRRRPQPEEDPSVMRHYLRVVKKRATGHIDALIAGLLAEEARGKAIEDGALMPAPIFAMAWGSSPFNSFD